jgi:hypothetical protein
MDLGDLGNFSASSLFAGFAFGVFGWYVMQLGRKQSNPWHIVIGLALMVYPYFITGTWLMWGTGIGLLTLAYAKR